MGVVWNDGDIITSEKLNSIETRINTNIEDIEKIKNAVTSGGSIPSDGSGVAKNDYVFDLRYIVPSSHGQIMETKSRVNQSLGVNCMTGELFAGRRFDEEDSACMIAKFSENGTLVKEVTVYRGGHGTCFGVEPVWNSSTEHWDSYIWSYIDYNSVPHLIRFNFDAFADGATITSSSEGVMLRNLNLSSSIDTLIPSIDYPNDTIAVCVKDYTPNKEYYAITYKLSDLREGRINKLNEVRFSKESSRLQGFTVANGRIYHRVGNSDGTEKDRLYVYDCSTNLFLYEINTSLLEPVLSNNNETGGFREPEGMCMYINPQTGKQSLFLCTSIGGSGRRIHMLHAYHQDSGASFVGRLTGKGQHVAITAPDGTLKNIPPYATSFEDITDVGEYYLTSAEYSRMTDRPVNVDTSGWILIVSGRKGESDLIECSQRLISNAKRFFSEYIRIFRVGDPSPWKATTAEYVPIIDVSTDLSTYNHSGTYYFTTAEMDAMTDKPANLSSGSYFLEVSVRNLNDVFIQTLTKHTITGLPKIYKRVVQGDGSASPWAMVSSTIEILSQSEYNNLSTKNSSVIYIIK